jgi:hypothetical protein
VDPVPDHRLGRQNGTVHPALVTEIMQRRSHPEQGFRSCLGVMRLGKRYTPQRLEKACERAVAIGAYTFKNVESILKNGLDRQPPTPTANRLDGRSPQHQRIALLPPQGGQPMLTQQTLDKLHDMKLTPWPRPSLSSWGNRTWGN